MSHPAAPGGSSRPALAAGIGCYAIWATLPILFIAMHRAGASALEILCQRALWAAPWAGGLVLMSHQSRQVLAILGRPKVLGALLLSTALIGVNWGLFVWAVNNGHNLEASLGYFINPLMAMVAGAVIFRERLNRIAWTAIGLATAGVALQTLALGHIPLISLTLAAAFCAYGIVRKRVDADAQAGLFVECVLMAIPAVAIELWLARTGQAAFGRHTGSSLLLAINGPFTAIPLALFAWAARRLPYSTMGLLQFIAPTSGFFVGLAMGEPLTLLRGVSFGFIWAGAGLYIYGAWRATRNVPALAGQSAA